MNAKSFIRGGFRVVTPADGTHRTHDAIPPSAWTTVPVNPPDTFVLRQAAHLGFQIVHEDDHPLALVAVSSDSDGDPDLWALEAAAAGLTLVRLPLTPDRSRESRWFVCEPM